MDEQYKEIEYRGTKVKVSKNGDVIWNGTKRTPYLNADGYPVCTIKIDGAGWRSVGIARLVAMAFIPNPNNLPEINHKDYNRQNYNIDNLEWMTHADNVRYSVCNKPDICGINNPNYGNRKLSQIYASNPELSKEKQGRPGTKNGRCVPVSMITPEGQRLRFDYTRLCAEYLHKTVSPQASVYSIEVRIRKAMKSNKCYKGIRFIKEQSEK